MSLGDSWLPPQQNGLMSLLHVAAQPAMTDNADQSPLRSRSLVAICDARKPKMNDIMRGFLRAELTGKRTRELVGLGNVVSQGAA